MPCSSSLPRQLVKDCIDPDFKAFQSDLGVDFDDDAFHYVTQTHEANWKATLKYDRIYSDPKFSEEELNGVVQDMLEFFEPLKDSCPILPLDQVDYNTKSSPGFIMKKVFGCKNKLDVVQKHEDYLNLFWEKAHKEKYPTLWTQSGKVEMLKSSKIRNNDVRAFTIIPAEMFFSLARMSQSFNAILCDSYRTMPIKHGINLSYGGFKDLLEKMTLHNMFVGEGDCRKWDSSMVQLLLELAKIVRFYCWDKKGMSVEEWWERMDYYYDETITTCLYNSTGEVLIKFAGQPSGTVNTTDDNCLAHLFVFCSLFRRHTGKSLYKLWHINVELALYADDHLFTVTGLTAPIHDFELRRNHYARFGLDLDAEKDVVSRSFDGHTFLGLTAENHNGVLHPVYNWLKALNSLQKSDTQLDPEAKLSKSISFMLLLAYAPQFDVVAKYARFLVRKYPYLEIFHIPSHREAQNFWLRKEAVQKETVLWNDLINLKLLEKSPLRNTRNAYLSTINQ